MANKRMFNIKIVDSDAFLDMPLSSQCLYFHLNMRADDDGFVGNPKRIQRLVGASEDDLKLLIAKRFLLTFENGVIVIKHWRMHNTLSTNRYSETVYTDEKKLLKLKENNSYSFDKGIPIDDTKLIERSSRQVRRTIDATKTHADKDIDLDIDIDKELDIKEKEINKEKESFYLVVLTMMLDTGDEYEITESMLKEWQQLHPKVNVLEEMQEMKAWLYANPNKRKTKRGMKRFINSWLSRSKSYSENRSGNNAEPKVPDWYKNTGETEPDDELLKQVEEMKRGLNRET